MNDNGIGERIKNRRIKLGISQEELAIKIGLQSRSSICKIESNARNLTQQRIKMIADALETTPSYIMGWDENEHTEQDEIIQEFCKMNENNKKHLLEYARFLNAGITEKD